MRNSRLRSWLIAGAVLVGCAIGYAAVPAASWAAQGNKKLPSGASDQYVGPQNNNPANNRPSGASDQYVRGGQKNNPGSKLAAQFYVPIPRERIVTERDLLGVLATFPPGRVITERDLSEALKSLPTDRRIMAPERVITEREINEAFRSLPPDREITVRDVSEALRSMKTTRVIQQPDVTLRVTGTGPDRLEQITALDEALWGKGARINVCWDIASDAYSPERSWVQDAISKSWQASADVEFRGWEACPAVFLPGTVFPGIRMTVSDTEDGAYTLGLGKGLYGRPGGIVLNFTFAKWKKTQCGVPNSAEKRESCIRSVAVHEFGHALGFAHEQTRADTPRECDEEKTGGTGDTNLTEYDPDSVMNYCNPNRNKGVLSALDKAGVQEAYGVRA